MIKHNLILTIIIIINYINFDKQLFINLNFLKYVK